MIFKKVKPLYLKTAIVLALSFAVLMGASLTSAKQSSKPWKFGVMSDTQWKANVDGQNQETVAVGIINQINKEFIGHGVKFVIQVGDLVDKETDSPNGFPANRTMDTRSAAAQALYDAGIGFYPVRGNHEGSQAAALEFQLLYPQTVGGGDHVFGATEFNSPVFVTDSSPDKLKGLSYSFEYENSRFILLDQFTRTDGSNYLGNGNNNIIDQLSWIDDQLSSKQENTHTFVFSHKNLIGQNHADDLFGSNPSYDTFGNVAARNSFIDSLMENGVRYCFSGHDHMHHHSIIANPENSAHVEEIICASNSYKFYIPQDPSNDERYNVPAFGGTREIPISEELFTVGYYIVTVDGPRVTVEYYASPNGCNGDCDLSVTPALTFSKRDIFGYSLNGKAFQVSQGGSYSVVQDSYNGTTARILNGVNESSATTYDGRALIKAVNTGWTTECPCRHKKKRFGHCNDRDDLASNILTLKGMNDLGQEQTDTYTLSMSYDHKMALPVLFGRGDFGIVTMDEDGDWINAVDANSGGTKKFVVGPWKPGYELGTFGVDPRTRTAWAVINYVGEFAVAKSMKHGQCRRK